MKIVYLPSTREDLLWLRRYHEQVFPEGLQRAQKQFHSIELLLAGNPQIGHPTHRVDVRELSIPRTPFSYIYRIAQDRIEILRIWDERRERID